MSDPMRPRLVEVEAAATNGTARPLRRRQHGVRGHITPSSTTSFVAPRATRLPREDLLQEAFLRLTREVDAGRTPEHVRGWLYRVASESRDQPRPSVRSAFTLLRAAGEPIGPVDFGRRATRGPHRGERPSTTGNEGGEWNGCGLSVAAHSSQSSSVSTRVPSFAFGVIAAHASRQVS